MSTYIYIYICTNTIATGLTAYHDVIVSVDPCQYGEKHFHEKKLLVTSHKTSQCVSSDLDPSEASHYIILWYTCSSINAH